MDVLLCILKKILSKRMILETATYNTDILSFESEFN